MSIEKKTKMDQKRTLNVVIRMHFPGFAENAQHTSKIQFFLKFWGRRTDAKEKNGRKGETFLRFALVQEWTRQTLISYEAL